MNMLKIAALPDCDSRPAGLSVFITLLLLLAAPASLAQEGDDFKVLAPVVGDGRLVLKMQIMSPAYESDPQTLKVVPPEDWYAAPASKPAEK